MRSTFRGRLGVVAADDSSVAATLDRQLSAARVESWSPASVTDGEHAWDCVVFEKSCWTRLGRPGERETGAPVVVVFEAPSEHPPVDPGVTEFLPRKGFQTQPETVAERIGTVTDRWRQRQHRDHEQTIRDSERRLRALLDRIDEAVLLTPAVDLTSADLTVDFLSSGYEDIWGKPLPEIVDSNGDGFFDTLHPADRGEYRSFVERVVDDIEHNRAQDSYSMEYRIERADGECRWVLSDVYPVESHDEPARVVVVSRDVTDRYEREHELSSFHEATATLTTADDEEEACRRAVRVAANVFGVDRAAVFRYDDGELTPVATTVPLETDVDSLPALDGSDTAAWTAFADGKPVRVERDELEALAVGDAEVVSVLPLREHGVMAVWENTEHIEAELIETAHVVAATLEAALNHIRGRRELQSQREQLTAEQERARTFAWLTALTREIESAITDASTRAEIEELVCDRLLTVEPFVTAWVGTADIGADRLEPSAAAGADTESVARRLRMSAGTSHPANTAWETGSVQTVEDVAASGPQSGWRQSLVRAGVGSVCSIPLRYDGVTHGVLTVVAEQPREFSTTERRVLEQLGVSIGHAITALRRRRALEADSTVAIEFHGDTRMLPFGDLAVEMGCTARHERTVRGEDGGTALHISLRGRSDDAIVDEVERSFGPEVSTVTRSGKGVLVEWSTDDWIGSLLSSYGGVIRRAEVDPKSGTTLTAELPEHVDVRGFVEQLRERYDCLDVGAVRRHQPQEPRPFGFTERLEQRLTDRQCEVLRTAHTRGYFEWPRESSSEEVADQLGITQPTVTKHLRLAENKLFTLLFDEVGLDADDL